MTAVPASGVVAETMVALVLASEVLRKFGGDSLDRARAQPRRVPRVAVVSGSWAHVSAPRHLALVGLMGAGKTTVGESAAPSSSGGPSSTPTTSSRRRSA